MAVSRKADAKKSISDHERQVRRLRGVTKSAGPRQVVSHNATASRTGRSSSSVGRETGEEWTKIVKEKGIERKLPKREVNNLQEQAETAR